VSQSLWEVAKTLLIVTQQQLQIIEGAETVENMTFDEIRRLCALVETVGLEGSSGTGLYGQVAAESLLSHVSVALHLHFMDKSYSKHSGP
jgi:hypothetical protein